jgi:hypothetical protein
LAKITDMFFSVLVDMDSVNAMAAYRPVVQACGSRWREEGTFVTSLLLQGKAAPKLCLSHVHFEGSIQNISFLNK